MYRLAQADPEYAARLQRLYRLDTDEELRARRSDAEWNLAAGDDDEYDAETVRNSRAYNLAIIAAVDQELARRKRRGVSRGPVDLGIPRDVLDELKARIPIEDEIGIARHLVRRGSILKALCPFHEDRDPSLVVWPARGRWKCFVCDVGGDLFAWVQAYSHMTFPEAVSYLQARAGMPVPKRPEHNHGGAFEYRRGKLVER